MRAVNTFFSYNAVFELFSVNLVAKISRFPHIAELT